MTVAHLDYETFSTVNLNTQGLWPYARHPSTRILCFSWAGEKEEPKAWWHGQPIHDEIKQIFKYCEIHAFNATFEAAITECVGPRTGLPMPNLKQWVDTQAIARMCAFPDSLAGCATALKLPINKDDDGGRLIRLFSIPQRNGAIVMPNDQPHEFRKMVQYCRQDVRVDRGVAAALPIKALPGIERDVWMVDYIINRRGVYIDRAMATGATVLAVHARSVASKMLPKMTVTPEFPDGMVQTVGQRDKILAFCASKGYPISDLSKETLEPLMDSPEMPEEVLNVLELRAGANMTSVSKYKKMLTVVGEDDRIRGAHAYHSATTGRWGGRVVQFQNLPRPSTKLSDTDHSLIRDKDAATLSLLYGNIMPVLRDAIRNTVQAAPEHELFVVDKASIEARVLGYYSGCKGYLRAYKEALDLYKVTAALIYSIKYGDVDDEQRWLGKTVVLGLGYGMGEDTFFANCKKNGRLLSKALVSRAVKTYRTAYSEIPAYWRHVEAECVRALKTGRVQTIGKGLFAEMVGKHLTIMLPSGRRLWYPNAYIKERPTRWGKMQSVIHFYTKVGKLWMVSTTYGGRLVENIVQAISRDLLAIALIKCERAGMRPVLHIHDEIICEVPKGKFKLDDMHAIFRSPPSWAPDLLLGSGGFQGQFYKKA